MVSRVLLCVCAAFYLASVLALSFSDHRRGFLQLSPFRKLLFLALVVHAGVILCRAWLVSRPPVFDRSELLSLFALCCGVLCLVAARWLGSRFVIGWGVSCAFAVTSFLGLRFELKALPDIDAIHGVLAWWYGVATPLAYAASFLAFAAQLRAIFALAQCAKAADPDLVQPNEQLMNSRSLGLLRFCYPLLISGFVAFAVYSLEAVGRGWFWQRSVAAQLFTLVAYTIYLHLCTVMPTQKGMIFAAQAAGFCGAVVSVLSFDLPQGLLRGVGLDALM